MDLLLDLQDSCCRLQRRYCATDDLTACPLQTQDLLYGCLHILGLRIGHGLDGDRIAAADLPVSDLYYFGMHSVSIFIVHKGT